MANSLAESRKNMKRIESRKSHSWWWDSHISPKNSRWLAENLEEMDQSVKRMLKLVEEDGDSFAKKAEMYYQKRPELISHVGQFYCMYRSLAERYDHLTGELRKNIPSDLQSQGSGVSDMSSESPCTWPSPDLKPSLRKCGPRPAGFDVFLGSAGSSSDVYHKEGDESSSLTDSDSESDASSVNNYSISLTNGGVQGLNRRIMELEIELREMKEKLRMQQGDNVDAPRGGAKNETVDSLLSRIAGYEQELRMANEKIKLSEEEIARLGMELQKYKSLETCEFEPSGEKYDTLQDDNEIKQAPERIGVLGEDSPDPDGKVQVLLEELRIMKEKLQNSEKEIASFKLEGDQSSEKIQHLKDQLELVQKDVGTWKSKVNAEKREVSKLQERIARLKTSLSDRDHEIRDLKTAVSDAEEKIFPEKAHIKAEISKLLDERTCLEEQLREWESRGRCLEEEIRKVVNGKRESEERLQAEIQQLKVEISERVECINNLKENLDALKAEREEVEGKVESLKAEVSCRDEQMNEMEKHLNQLQMEHGELIGNAEGARKQVEELRWKAKELEKEIERQRVIILEGAEMKREAIRQLCFSLEHYRNGYHRLRQAFERKRVSVLAS